MPVDDRGPWPLIGVLGAGGAVGGFLVAEARRLGLGQLRLGLRRPPAARELLDRYGAAGQVMVADAGDPDQLTAFCSGCRVVVNCTGGRGQDRAEVASAALAAGADYLDPGGDDALRARLAAQVLPAGRVALVAAGVQPGLSELLPRWLAAKGLRPPLSLTAYLGTLDRMTRASAEDFLLSLSQGAGQGQALWRAGARQGRAIEPIAELSLPFFPGPLIAYPYLSAEAERMARQLGLAEARCYYVFESGGNILTVLSRLQHQLQQHQLQQHQLQQDQRAGSEAALGRLADELIRAVEVEMFGREPVQQLVVQLDGRAGGEPASRLAVLRTSSTYQLTAVVTALAAMQLLAGVIPAGAHAAADVLDPSLIDALPGRPGVAGLHLLDRPLPEYARSDQGAV
jgi:hypothetical protein